MLISDSKKMKYVSAFAIKRNKNTNKRKTNKKIINIGKLSSKKFRHPKTIKATTT